MILIKTIKKSYSKILKIGSITLLVIIMLSNLGLAASLGISPTALNYKIARGKEYSNKIMISSNANEEVSVKMQASGVISKWVNFEPETFKIDRMNPQNVRVTLRAPIAAWKEQYNGTITAYSQPEGSASNGHGALIQTAISLPLRVNIVNKADMPEPIPDKVFDTPAQIGIGKAISGFESKPPSNTFGLLVIGFIVMAGMVSSSFLIINKHKKSKKYKKREPGFRLL